MVSLLHRATIKNIEIKGQKYIGPLLHRAAIIRTVDPWRLHRSEILKSNNILTRNRGFKYGVSSRLRETSVEAATLDDSRTKNLYRLDLLMHLITFRVRHSRCKMYIGHGRVCVCVCLSVCLPVPVAFSHYCTDPDVTWGNGRDAL